MSELKKDGIRAAMSEQVEKETLKSMAQRATTDNEQTLEPCGEGRELINVREALKVLSEFCDGTQPFVGERFKKQLRNAIRAIPRVSAASTAPVVDEDALKKRARQIIDAVIESPVIVEVRVFSQIEEMGRLEDRIAAMLQGYAAASPAAPAIKHHKLCSVWTVTTSGEAKPCDCVCECNHGMAEHLRRGQDAWFEECAHSGCKCQKFAAPAAPQEDALVDEVQHRMDQVVEAAVEWHQAGREGGEMV